MTQICFKLYYIKAIEIKKQMNVTEFHFNAILHQSKQVYLLHNISVAVRTNPNCSISYINLKPKRKLFLSNSKTF